MCIVCVCVCALLSQSLVTVSGHLATREFPHQPTRYRKPSRHQPTRHQETITPPTNSPPNKVVESLFERKQSSRDEKAVQRKFTYLSYLSVEGKPYSHNTMKANFFRAGQIFFWFSSKKLSGIKYSSWQTKL